MEEKVYAVFDELKIKYKKVEHPPLFKAIDNDKYNIVFDGMICKNLFIRNKDKSNFYLVSMPLKKRMDLKDLQEKLGESRLSFGNEDELSNKLKTKSGNVSLLNIIEIEDTDVTFVIDSDVLKVDKVGFHPNINTSTLLFTPQSIEKILKKYNAKYIFIDLNK